MASFSIRLTVSRSFGVGEGFLGLGTSSSFSGFGGATLVPFFLPFFLPLACVGLLLPEV